MFEIEIAHDTFTVNKGKNEIIVSTHRLQNFVAISAVIDYTSACFQSACSLILYRLIYKREEKLFEIIASEKIHTR